MPDIMAFLTQAYAIIRVIANGDSPDSPPVRSTPKLKSCYHPLVTTNPLLLHELDHI